MERAEDGEGTGKGSNIMYKPKREAERIHTSRIDLVGLPLRGSVRSVGVVAVRLDRVVLRMIKTASAGSRRHWINQRT